MHATGKRVARIVGAGIAVVAVGRRAADALAADAGVAHRAGTAVAAGRVVVLEDATARRVTGVYRARVAVITFGGRIGDAGAAGAVIAQRTGIAVIAGEVVVVEGTT